MRHNHCQKPVKVLPFAQAAFGIVRKTPPLPRPLDDRNALPELALYYQQQMYAENQRIEAIDREQRQVTFEDLAQISWVGEFRDALGLS